MAANFSLQKSIRTCRVDSSWANKAHSERFLNSCDLACPAWNGLDAYGRTVCQDSFKLESTQNPGCITPMDRISIENEHRPQYSTYTSLNMYGVTGDLYSSPPGVAKQEVDAIISSNGKVGLDFNRIIQPKCRTLKVSAQTYPVTPPLTSW